MQKINSGMSGLQVAQLLFDNDQEALNTLGLYVVANLFDNNVTNVIAGYRLGAAGGTLTSNSSTPTIVTSAPIPVLSGQWYTISGTGINLYSGGTTPRGTLSTVATTTAPLTAPLYDPNFTAITGGFKFQSPIDGYLYVDLALKADLSSFAGPVMISTGQAVKEYTNKGTPILASSLVQISKWLRDAGVIVQASENMINPANINYALRYSSGTSKIQAADANLIASSGFIEVTEGEFYTVSGAGIFSNYQGGYFGATASPVLGQTAISNITFALPVSGSGRTFQVPTGLGIKYALISLATDATHTTLAGTAQMEKGEMATAYKPYAPVLRINPNLLPPTTNGGGTSSPGSPLEKYTTFGNLSYKLGGKLPKYRAAAIAKNKDFVVVNTGTSLTARTVEHCTEHPDAKFRPPLMHSLNFASYIWDALKWQGQQYRRYDSGYFTESAGFATSAALSNWDDALYRDSLTRYIDGGNASVQFAIPANAWQFNFIHRLDDQGTLNALVSVAEGNGLVQVFNESTGTWVEANGFSFSQRQPPAVTLASVTYLSPITNTNTTTTNYPVGGNTTYQKRLKFRCRNSSGLNSTATAKTVTISKTTGRLMYWGVEWSSREFMITYINAARGSHTSTIDSTRSLLKFQDNEIWVFKPDLILTENPIHNAGGGNLPNSTYPSTYWGITSDNFFFANNGVSLKARATALGVSSNLEWAIFNSSITYNFGAIDTDGTLITNVDASGRAITALDAQMMANEYLALQYPNPDVVIIQAVKHFIDAARACYAGNLRTATEGSGKTGATFTNEGSHWNNTGCKVMARIVLPILDLYY